MAEKSIINLLFKKNWMNLYANREEFVDWFVAVAPNFWVNGGGEIGRKRQQQKTRAPRKILKKFKKSYKNFFYKKFQTVNFSAILKKLSNSS